MSLIHKTGVIPYFKDIVILDKSLDANFDDVSLNNITINADMVMNKGAFEAYVTGNTTATSLTANIPAVVAFGAGKVFNGFSAGFTVDTTTNLGRITYLATRTRTAHCGITLSWFASQDQIIATFYIKKMVLF